MYDTLEAVLEVTRNAAAGPRPRSSDEFAADRSGSQSSGSAIDRVCLPCSSDTTAIARPLLTVGVTLTAW